MPAESVLVNIFCKNLRQLRVDRGVTQVEMADRLGITQATYSRIEAGKSTPDLPALENIAAALEVVPTTLISPAAGLQKATRKATT